MINKDGYYLIQHAKPISKINNQTPRIDLKSYLIINNEIPLEVYYVFTDEIIKDLERKDKEWDR